MQQENGYLLFPGKAGVKQWPGAVAEFVEDQFSCIVVEESDSMCLYGSEKMCE